MVNLLLFFLSTLSSGFLLFSCHLRMDHHHHLHHHLYHVHHANGNLSNGVGGVGTQYFNSPRGTFISLARSPASPPLCPPPPPPPPGPVTHPSASMSPPYASVSMLDPFASPMRRFSESDCNQPDCQSLPGPSSQSAYSGNCKSSSSHLAQSHHQPHPHHHPHHHHRKMPSVDKNDPNYQQRRSRNNEAVKKSREKKKKESEQVHKEVKYLERENEKLKAHLLKQKTSYETLKDLWESANGKMDIRTEQSLFQHQD